MLVLVFRPKLCFAGIAPRLAAFLGGDDSVGCRDSRINLRIHGDRPITNKKANQHRDLTPFLVWSRVLFEVMPAKVAVRAGW